MFDQRSDDCSEGSEAFADGRCLHAKTEGQVMHAGASSAQEPRAEGPPLDTYLLG